MFTKYILTFALMFTAANLGFLIWTYFIPWYILWDSPQCGESPIGFYKFQIVPYELTDYGGAEIQAGQPLGGYLDFLKFYLGKHELCN